MYSGGSTGNSYKIQKNPNHRNREKDEDKNLFDNSKKRVTYRKYLLEYIKH